MELIRQRQGRDDLVRCRKVRAKHTHVAQLCICHLIRRDISWHKYVIRANPHQYEPKRAETISLVDALHARPMRYRARDAYRPICMAMAQANLAAMED